MAIHGGLHRGLLLARTIGVCGGTLMARPALPLLERQGGATRLVVEGAHLRAIDGDAHLVVMLQVENEIVDGKRVNRRWPNGDQAHQGRHVRLEPGRFSIPARPALSVSLTSRRAAYFPRSFPGGPSTPFGRNSLAS